MDMGAIVAETGPGRGLRRATRGHILNDAHKETTPMPFKPTYDVAPERQPYTLFPDSPDAGRPGVLFLHGFMGSPLSSRPLADYLRDRGYFVHCPLLPGHGQYPNKLYQVSRQAWIAEAEEAYDLTRTNCDELFVIGHSMGNILGAHLVTTRGGFQAMAMIAPVYEPPDGRLRFTGIAQHFTPWYYPHKSKRESMQHLVRERVLDFDPTIDFDDPDFQAQLPEVSRVPMSGMYQMVKTIAYGRALWPKLDLPVSIFAGEDDVAAPPDNARRIYAALPHADKHLTIYPNSGHELMRPFDPVHQEAWAAIAEFLAAHRRTAAAPE
jgi:carboxylesterase